MIEAEIECVEIAPAARRQRVGGAVGEERHALFGDAAVRAQRRRESGQIVTIARGADEGQTLGDDEELAQAILGQLETRTRSAARPLERAPRERRYQQASGLAQ